MWVNRKKNPWGVSHFATSEYTHAKLHHTKTACGLVTTTDNVANTDYEVANGYEGRCKTCSKTSPCDHNLGDA